MKLKLLEPSFYSEVTKGRDKNYPCVIVYIIRNLVSPNAYLQHTRHNNLLQQLPGVEVY